MRLDAAGTPLMKVVARTPLITVVAALVAALVAAVPASGTEPGPPVAFTDAVGDANYVNNQGLPDTPVGDDGPDTRPASVASADLVEGRWETAYTSVPEHDADGRVVAVRRLPTGLRLHVRTAAPVIPSFGPTVSLEVWVFAAGCPMIFRLWARGPLSGEHDPPEGAELRTRAAVCPEGPRTYRDEISVDVRGPVAILEFPFAALDTPAGPVLRAGDRISPDLDGRAARTATVHGLPNGLLVGGPVIDMASPIEQFVIGSDVPPDLDCLAAPSDPECLGHEGTADTGADLHALLLGSDDPVGVRAGATLDVGEEFGVYSFRPDGRWATFAFDVAAAGFTREWVHVDMAARLLGDGEVLDFEWLRYEDAFANWKLFYGPADDPYRNVASLLQDTPWGGTLSLPASDLERLTLLVGADVDGHEEVALALGLSEADAPFFGETSPESFADWVQEFTAGKDKVRLVADHSGRGAQLALWLVTSVRELRRGVTVDDDRSDLGEARGPGTVQLTAVLESAGPALTTALLSYPNRTGQYGVALDWRTPRETRRGRGLPGATMSAVATDGGPGTYTLWLGVDSVVETSWPPVTYVQDLWDLDPAVVFPGLEGRFTSNLAADDPVVMTGGSLVVDDPLVMSGGSLVSSGGRHGRA